MQVRICKEVEIDTEVSVGIEEIRAALCEAVQEGKNNPGESRAVQRMVTACWKTLTAMTDEQIESLGPANRQHVANAMRVLADRIQGEA